MGTFLGGSIVLQPPPEVAPRCRGNDLVSPLGTEIFAIVLPSTASVSMCNLHRWHRSIPHQGGDSVGRLVGRVAALSRVPSSSTAKVDGSAFGVGHGDRDCDQVIVGQTFPIALELDR